MGSFTGKTAVFTGVTMKGVQGRETDSSTMERAKVYVRAYGVEEYLKVRVFTNSHEELQTGWFGMKGKFRLFADYF